MGHRLSLAAVAILTLVALGITSGLPDRPSGEPAAAQSEGPSVAIVVSSLWSDELARYSVTLARPAGVALQDVRVEVDLPPEADLLEVLETPGRTAFAGRQANTLAWTAPEFPADRPVDAFTFIVAKPLLSELSVRASWGGANPGQAETATIPDILRGGSDEGIAVLVAPPAGGLLPVGDSGVLIGAVPGVPFPDGALVAVTRLGPDQNPPQVASALWWCSLVDLQGIPEGSAVTVFAPARRPLPPDANVRLFARDDETWSDTGEAAAVSLDGQ
jgi:hypothetical protein